MSDEEDGRKIRYSPEVEKGMRQFLKLETGLGKSAKYRRGHIYSFEWCSEDPKLARPDLVKLVKDLMENVVDPLSFDDAFDHAMSLDKVLP